MRLLIFLMAVSSFSCRGIPTKPKFDLYQPVVGAVCDDNKECKEQAFCNVYQEVNGEWQFKEELSISRCSGILGVRSETFVEIKDYVRKVDTYIQSQCGNNTNEVAN